MLDPARHDARQRSLHPGHDDHHFRLVDSLSLIEETMEPGDADVEEPLDVTVRTLGGDRRLFRDRKIGRAGGDHQHATEPTRLALALAPGDAALFRVTDAGQPLGQRFGILRIDPRDHHVMTTGGQTLGDLEDLGSRLALREDHFGDALAQRPVVIDLGIAQVLVGKVA